MAAPKTWSNPAAALDKIRSRRLDWSHETDQSTLANSWWLRNLPYWQKPDPRSEGASRQRLGSYLGTSLTDDKLDVEATRGEIGLWNVG